jgi:glutamate/tyrosine decarboxylase-like PLP-dependent enzyme
MNETLASDATHLHEILGAALAEAEQFLQGVNDRPVIQPFAQHSTTALPQHGLGAQHTLNLFKQKYAEAISGSAGPRYFGFVTGGSTPAALLGDWLTSTYDQNAAIDDGSAASTIEKETVAMLRQLFGLSDQHSGAFVTGATMANFVGLALARQWLGQQHGVDVAATGLHTLPPMRILSGTPHSCIYKALAMLGLGKQQLQLVPVLMGREAVDLSALRGALRDELRTLNGQPCIVVANAGTVNTVDFDDIAAIVDLKREFNFWLHVDAAFGGFAACSPKFAHLLAGWDAADSIAIDAHKWLNVPYDSAMQFTRHIDLQLAVFQNAAAYLGTPSAADFVHLTPENSRRLRALPAWFTLNAYGAQGYRELVEQTCALASALGEKIAASVQFKLLAPVRMNVVCFTLAEDATAERIKQVLAAARDTGKAFFTPTVYKGMPAIRAAFSNWRTTQADVELAWQATHK